MQNIIYAELNFLSVVIIGMLLAKWILMKKRGTQNWLFTTLLTGASLFLLSDGIWAILDSDYVQVSPGVIYGINLFYFIMTAILPFVWYLYAGELQGKLLKDGGIFRLVRIVPLCVLLGMLLFNGSEQWIFYIDENGGYHRGSLHTIQVLCSHVYFAYPALKALVFMLFGPKEKRRVHFTVLTFVAWPLVFGILQKLLPGTPLLGMGITIALVQLFIYTISKEETRMEKEYHRILEEKNDMLEIALASAEAANKAKSVFLNNMSHDIRTPMNAIIGFAHIAKDNRGDVKMVTDCLAKIETAGKYLLELINDVLDMARIESGKMMFEERNVHMPTFLANLEDMVKTGMEQRKLRFHMDTEIVENNVFFDELRVTQVLMNLLSNAMKYTKPGGRVRLKTMQVDNDTDGMATFRFVVEDTGIGMSEAFQKTVFESFERETSHDTLHIEGSGLGLAITKNIVDLLGGSIELKSELGIGSEFVVELTFRVAEEATKEVSEEPVARRDFTGKRILLAEDNELNREIAVMLLTSVGFKVDCAEDGSVAIDKLKYAAPGYYDVILMDIQMPYMNGYKATSIIRGSMREGFKEIPIVAMTANAFEEDRKKALECGMNAHVAKPMDIDVLLKTLEKLL